MKEKVVIIGGKGTAVVIAEQIYETQSLEDISYNEDSPYTSQIIINAIEDALSKGKVE